MTDPRSLLIDALRRANAGNDIEATELFDVIPDPSSLETIEKRAWQRLSHWIDDGDIRAKDPSYAERQEKEIADALADLEALEAGYIPSEVELGEHQGSPFPLSACLLFVGVLALAAYLISKYLL